jgi:predicted small lipoprotein YifL
MFGALLGTSLVLSVAGCGGPNDLVVPDAEDPPQPDPQVTQSETSAGDRLRVQVRALEPGATPCAPLVIGERAGRLSLVAGERDGVGNERGYAVELEVDDHVLGFVSPEQAQWVKAWVESPGPDEE